MSDSDSDITLWKDMFKKRQIKFDHAKQNLEQKQYELTKYMLENPGLDFKKMEKDVENEKNIVLMAKTRMLIAKHNIDHCMILSGNRMQLDATLYGITADQHKAVVVSSIFKLFNIKV